MKFNWKFNWQVLGAAAATFIILYSAKLVYDHYYTPGPPEVCLIAGEGVSLRWGDRMILMDALFREGFPEDKLPSDGLMTAIENAEPPYDRVRLVTVSHKHIDHFGIESLAKFMAANQAATVLMPPEAAEEFFDAGYHGLADRVMSIYPERGTPQHFEVNGIQVTVYNLDHRTEVENIGVMVELAGRSYFHMGDFAAADFEANGVKGLKVDYLLLPYWYLRNAENFQLITDNIEADYLVPIHMPGPDLPEDFAERVGSFEDLFAAVSMRADNVLMLYNEGSCFRPDQE